MKQLWERHKGALLCAVAVAGVYLALFAVGITCPIKYVTGISCPGCGMSRALLCLITGHFSAALHYHPLCVAVPVVLPLFVWLQTKRKRMACRLLSAAAVTALVVTYLWRLWTGEGDVVVFEPQNGLLARLVALLFP